MWLVQIKVSEAELGPVKEIGNILLPALPVGLILCDVGMPVFPPVPQAVVLQAPSFDCRMQAIEAG